MSRTPPGFLDAASGQPLSAAGRTALLAALDAGWADPARLHRPARQARLLLDAARESVAARLGCAPDELSFDTGLESALRRGTRGALQGRVRHGDRLVVSAVEHSSVLHVAAAHERAGGRVHIVGVDRTGRVDAADFIAQARESAVAVLQAANHEVGTLQPVDEVAAGLAGVPLVVDAHQVIGRTDLPTGWSVLAGSARHWGGPAGVAVLAVRRGTRWRPVEDPSDGREAGRVPGVPDVPAIVAAAAALEDVHAHREAESRRLSDLVERIRTQVPLLVPDVEVVGDPVRRLPHIVTFSCLYVDGEALLTALDREGFAVSSGSACTSDVLAPSHVLVAMGVLSQGNVRVSLPQGVEADDVERFLAVLPRVVAEVRGMLGADRI